MKEVAKIKRSSENNFWYRQASKI